LTSWFKLRPSLLSHVHNNFFAINVVGHGVTKQIPNRSTRGLRPAWSKASPSERRKDQNWRSGLAAVRLPARLSRGTRPVFCSGLPVRRSRVSKVESRGAEADPSSTLSSSAMNIRNATLRRRSKEWALRIGPKIEPGRQPIHKSFIGSAK
jgi:hypothetical protein